MAITENVFTTDELKAAITAKPELVTIVTEVLTKEQKLKVFKDEEFTAEVQKVERAAIDRTTADIYGNIDKDLESLGFKKENPEEKTYDRNKKAITTLSGKVADLEKKLKDNSGDTVLKQQLEAAQAAEKKAREDLAALTTEHRTEKIKGHVESGLVGKAFRKDLPNIMIESTIENQKQKLISNAVYSEGKIYFKDETGKAILKQGTSDFATANEILSERLKDLFDNGGGAGEGAGTKPVTGADTGVKNPEGKSIIVPAEIDTKVKLHEYLKKQGLTTTSKEFMEIDAKYKDLKLR
jgi:hypothetical protein